MRTTIFMLALFLVATSLLAGENWPQFRGQNASGVSETPGPAKWNVRWKIPVAGLGHSCPVAWGDRLFITTAVPVAGGHEKLKTGLYGDIEPVDDEGEQRWLVLCFDKASGKQLWEREAHRGMPKIMRHPKSSHANPTVATDGKRVVAFFGSEGLYCYDLDGTPLWKKDFGVLDSAFFAVPSARWGFATSPVIFGDHVVVLADVQKDSFLAVLDAKTGEQRWRTPRNDVPTWGTPTVHRIDDARTQIIVNGFKEIAGYDFASGKQVWHMSGGGDIPVPTPVVAHGLAFITGAHGPNSPVFAVRLDKAAGDISLPKGKSSSDAVAWSVQVGNYMQTPIVVGDLLYCCRDNGVLTVFDARTGKKHYHHRFDGPGFTASPVAAADRLYFTSEDGRVNVIKAGATFEHVSEHDLGEACLATPALSDGTIFFRTRGHLVAVGG